MRKILSLVVALCLLLTLAGAAAAEGKLIGYTCMDGTNPFFVALEGAIKEVVEAHGDTLISLDPQNSNEKQIAQIEDMISRGVVAMFVNPVDRDGITPGLDKLKDAGIPMFGFDTEVTEMSYLVTYAGSDNYNAGFVCGVDLAKKCPEGGDIIVLDSPTMQSVVDRTDGFLKAIAAADIPLKGRIVIVGCGGVARTFAYEAVLAGCGVTIAARPEDAAMQQALREDIISKLEGASVSCCSIENIQGDCDLLINATPVGMYPRTDASPVTDRILSHCACVFDAVYNPLRTLLLKKAEANGSRVAGGMAMLVWQAAVAHEIWDGSVYNNDDIAMLIEDSAKEQTKRFC